MPLWSSNSAAAEAPRPSASRYLCCRRPSLRLAKKRAPFAVLRRPKPAIPSTPTFGQRPSAVSRAGAALPAQCSGSSQIWLSAPAEAAADAARLASPHPASALPVAAFVDSAITRTVGCSASISQALASLRAELEALPINSFPSGVLRLEVVLPRGLDSLAWLRTLPGGSSPLLPQAFFAPRTPPPVPLGDLADIALDTPLPASALPSQQVQPHKVWMSPFPHSQALEIAVLSVPWLVLELLGFGVVPLVLCSMPVLATG